MQLLKTNYRGRGKWGAVARALNAIGKAVNSARGQNGISVLDIGGEMVIQGSGVTSSGTAHHRVFCAGVKVHDNWTTISTACFVVWRSGVVEEWEGPIPISMPTDGEVYEKASEFGDVRAWPRGG